MNYRHAYHAGNFADVLKHAIIARTLTYLKQKPAPFRVIDTHAGIGRYELTSLEATKTGEWAEGIGRIEAAQLSPALADFLAPYLAAVRALNPGGGLQHYPGSPVLVRELLRRDDRLIVNELHPGDHAELKALFDCDPQTKVMQIDGYLAVKSLLPPKERRGLVVVDPPFEVPGEFERMLTALADIRQRFSTGTSILWYPIKSEPEIAAFHDKAVRLSIPKILNVTLMVRAAGGSAGLPGTGLLIVNPPYTLNGELAAVLPELTSILAQGPGAASSIRWLTGEEV